MTKVRPKGIFRLNDTVFVRQNSLQTAAREHLIAAAQRGYSLWVGFRPYSQGAGKPNLLQIGAGHLIEKWAKEIGCHCKMEVGLQDMEEIESALLLATPEEDPLARHGVAFSAPFDFLSDLTRDTFIHQGVSRPKDLDRLKLVIAQVHRVFYSVIQNEGSSRVPVTRLAALQNSLLLPLLEI